MAFKSEDKRPYIELAQEIVDFLLDKQSDLSVESDPTEVQSEVVIEIGKKIANLEKSLPKKGKTLLATISEEIKKQLPDQKGVSPKELRDAVMLYKASCLFENFPFADLGNIEL